MANEKKPATMIEELMAAKKEFKPLLKNRVNPFTKSRYADLAAVLESIEDPLAAHGFMILHPFRFDEAGRFIMDTKIKHLPTGEAFESVYELPKGVDSQAMGSAITYGRRYSLCALLSLAADDDDDGEGAKTAAKPVNGANQAKPQPPKPAEKPKAATETYMGPIVKVIEIKRGLWGAVDPTEGVYGTNVPEHADFARSCVGKGPVKIVYRLNNAKSKFIISIEHVTQESKEAMNG